MQATAFSEVFQPRGAVPHPTQESDHRLEQLKAVLPVDVRYLHYRFAVPNTQKRMRDFSLHLELLVPAVN